jgi:hypothetical protein
MMTQPQIEKDQSGPSTGVKLAYVILFGSGLGMYHIVAAGEWSSILTMAAMLQTFAFALLGVQIMSSGHAVGISARALILDALALVFRLSSTTWLNGYIPVDASGDWAYQAVDICSLVICLWLLHQVLVVRKSTYQESEDSFPIVQVCSISFILAVLLHADMNDRPIFDTIWMTGLFISVFAVLPQLWLCQKAGGRVEAFTSHYIAAMAVARVLSGLFMWQAREDITSMEWVEGWNQGLYAILGAYFLHMVLLLDFGYYYVKALLKGDIVGRLQLGEDCWV